MFLTLQNASYVDCHALTAIFLHPQHRIVGSSDPRYSYFNIWFSKVSVVLHAISQIGRTCPTA